MKVKEVARTANVAWSPQGMQSIHLACGTVAQQLDATFSTNAKLEIFSLDLGVPGLDMTLAGSVETPHRFHKIVWSGHGMGEDHAKGLIIGGADNGVISLWSAERIINSRPDCTVASITQHTGSVRSLDINPFQPNLLASGAAESEIYIWDLNNPTTPMSPGNKTHPLEDISGVAWNCQVQHILASTSPGGRSVVWDLRKNEPIIQVADSSSRVQCSGIAWHPDVATQLATCSVDDRAPVIQMWDLRYATAPMRILEQHKRGILCLAWCRQDSDLLLSAAKDNRVLCWNPNSELPGGEVVYELPATSQWIFECQWCPRNPSIISTASFDGHVTMYSLLGGSGGGGAGAESAVDEVPTVPSSGGDFFDDVKASVSGRSQVVETTPLKTPPKWFRRPCGASFAFGGKLISFANTRGATLPKTVNISHVVTEEQFLRKSVDLERSLADGKYVDFCGEKVEECTDTMEKNMWNFLKVTFEENPRREYLKLLGYDVEELEKKFSTWSKMTASTLPAAGGLDVNELSHKLATVTVQEEREWEGAELPEEGVANSDDASSTAAIFGSETDRGADSSVFDSISLNDPASSVTSKRVSNASFLGVPGALSASSAFSIPTDKDGDGLLAQALLVGNFEAAVDICISTDRMAEAMVLAVAGGSDLLKRTQQVFFQKKPTKISKLISAVVNRNWTEVAKQGSLENWREILAVLVTYAGPEDFPTLCDVLGGRLETEAEGKYRTSASLCYICSGNVEKFVESLSEATPTAGERYDPLTLQEMMEKVVLLRKAVETERKSYDQTNSKVLNSKMWQYASLLASQGSLGTAYKYLTQDGDSFSAILRDRLYQAKGLTSSPRPAFPFAPVDVQPTLATPTQPSASRASTGQPRGGVATQQPTSRIEPSTGASNPFARGRGPSGGGVVGAGKGGGAGGVGVYTPGSMGTPDTFVGQEVPSPAHIPTVTAAYISQNPPSVSNPNIFNPLAPSVSKTQQPMTPPTVGNMYRSDAGAWNDPPTLRSKKAPVTTVTNVTPITAPIMTPVPQPQPQGPPSTMSESQTPHQPSPSPVQRTAPARAPPVAEKAPIPQEHSAMVQALEAMLARCRAAANNLGTKKKLDDIEKKLSILFDLLRVSKISPNVIQGLNFMAQSANNCDYQSGLGCYNQMVSSGNFSEISSFMPGIKSLLNLGMQLRV